MEAAPRCWLIRTILHLSSRHETKQVSLHTKGLPDFTACVAEERKWQALGLGKLCIGLWSIRGNAQHHSASILED